MEVDHAQPGIEPAGALELGDDGLHPAPPHPPAGVEAGQRVVAAVAATLRAAPGGDRAVDRPTVAGVGPVASGGQGAHAAILEQPAAAGQLAPHGQAVEILDQRPERRRVGLTPAPEVADPRRVPARQHRLAQLEQRLLTLPQAHPGDLLEACAGIDAGVNAAPDDLEAGLRRAQAAGDGHGPIEVHRHQAQAHQGRAAGGDEARHLVHGSGVVGREPGQEEQAGQHAGLQHAGVQAAGPQGLQAGLKADQDDLGPSGHAHGAGPGAGVASSSSSRRWASSS